MDMLKPLRMILLTGLLIIQKLAGLSDRAISLIIRFIVAFLTLFAVTLQIDVLQLFAKSIPVTYLSALKLLGQDGNDFK